MKRTPAVAAWTTLMLLLLASPAAAEAGSANEAAQWQPFGQVVSDTLQPANAPDKGNAQKAADTDKELEQIKTQMQELRQQMKSLHEKNTAACEEAWHCDGRQDQQADSTRVEGKVGQGRQTVPRETSQYGTSWRMIASHAEERRIGE